MASGGPFYSMRDEKNFINKIGNCCERSRDREEMLHRYYAVCLQRNDWGMLKKKDVLKYIKKCLTLPK